MGRFKDKSAKLSTGEQSDFPENLKGLVVQQKDWTYNELCNL
jgi:hypothetical protein